MDWAWSGRIGAQAGDWHRQASAAVFRFDFGFTWSLRDSCSKIQHTPMKALCSFCKRGLPPLLTSCFCLSFGERGRNFMYQICAGFDSLHEPNRFRSCTIPTPCPPSRLQRGDIFFIMFSWRASALSRVEINGRESCPLLTGLRNRQDNMQNPIYSLETSRE